VHLGSIEMVARVMARRVEPPLWDAGGEMPRYRSFGRAEFRPR